MLANNIANSSAPGFKADSEFYGLYLASEAADSPEGTNPAVMPVIERQWTNFAQGSLTPTNNPLDLAINGKGFLVANSGSSQLFTRDGSLRLSPQGVLETMDGYAIQSQSGKQIVLDPSRPIDIGPDGAVQQEGLEIARLAVVDFANPAALSKRGSNYFESDLTSMPPVAASAAEILQGKLEGSNSQPAESAVRLVNILRQFETLQKAVGIGTDMNRRVIDEVAKVTQ